MAISPFSTRPRHPDSESSRARVVVFLVVLGIGAALIAYAASPGVRHAVRSVKTSVSNVFDKDKKEKQSHSSTTSHTRTTAPAAGKSSTSGTGTHSGSTSSTTAGGTAAPPG